MKGLTSHQAQEKLKEIGPNIIKANHKKTIFQKFFEQFNNFLTYLLLVAAIISFVIGETIDGSLIIGIVVINAFFGLYQEHKAEGALNQLQKIAKTMVRVIRDGVEQELDSRELVPGDVIFIEEGMKVPADAKLIEEVNFQANEAALTGESLGVDKNVGDEIFMGTIVARGRGFAEIIKTGMTTKFGQIADRLLGLKIEATPLQKKLASLTKVIGAMGIAAAIVVFLLSYIVLGSGQFPSFLLAVSLAVAVVPQALPAVMTITLSIGVGEMAKKKSIVRRLSAIEGLGSVTLIATDKTGTLTTNKMRVRDVYANGQERELSHLLPDHIKKGKPHGVKKAIEVSKQFLIHVLAPKSHTATRLPSAEIAGSKPFHLMLLNGILCSTASLVYTHDHGSVDVLGDPTEGALLLMARDMGLHPEEVKKSFELIKENSFDAKTKMMSVVVQSKIKDQKSKSKTTVFSKGAPESIIPLCTKVFEGESEKKLSQSKREEIKAQVERWASKGLRILAFGYQEGRREKGEGGMTFLGLVAIHDAPRPEAREAVEAAHKAGIDVVMITGDNEKTAEAVGVVTGIIKEGGEIMTGAQLEKYSDEELMKHLPKVRVFARTTPFHKHRIVSLYQKLGEVVAVTGDGVNDAIALKQADVGVAMGLVGTDVARETADMVVTDDNFATIIDAVSEGRNTIRNLKNAIKYLLACNVTEAMALIITLLMGLPHLFFPIQLLYINLITDGIPALALAFSPRDKTTMQQPPNRRLSLIERLDRRYILSVGAIATLIVVSSYFLFARGGVDLGRTAAFSVLALIQSFIFVDLWLSHRPLAGNTSLLRSWFFGAAFAMAFVTQYVLVSFDSLAMLFRVITVSFAEYALFILAASLILPSIELLKHFMPRAKASK